MKAPVFIAAVTFVAGCAMLTPRTTPTASEETLVSRIENAILEKLIDDTVRELEVADPADRDKILKRYQDLLDRSVDEARLTPENRNQALLLRAVADTLVTTRPVSPETLRGAFEDAFASIPAGVTPEYWESLCETVGSPQEDYLQSRLNDVSRHVFDIEPALTGITSHLPGSDLEIRLLEASSPDHARFEPGQATSVLLLDLKQLPGCEIAARTYMNTIPGKLVVPQSRLSVALDIPWFMDGWALYSLTLLDERGLFTDQAQLAGRYRIELITLARAVIATSYDWPPASGVQFLESRLALPLDRATALVADTLREPGRYVSAADGYLSIKRLREEAQAALGPAFNEQSFHDRLLTGGPAPPPLVEQRIETWLSMAE